MRWRSLVVGVVVAAGAFAPVVLAGCGDQAGQVGTAADAAAHPFAVDQVPDGFRLVVAGRGNDEQYWDSEVGGDEPYTVLDTGGRTVVASIVAWEPMEGQLSAASRSGDRTPETITLDDGRTAVHGEGVDGQWSDLLIEVGPSEALKIASEGASRHQLVDVARHVRVTGDRGDAPTVDEPPAGWVVTGSVGVDALMAMRAATLDRSGEVPGPPSAYSMGWVDTGVNPNEGPEGSLSVMVLPGDRADLGALEGAPRLGWGDSAPVRRVTVAGRPGVLIESTAPYSSDPARSVVTHDGSGAMVVVSARGSRSPSGDTLVAIAGSVRPVDAEEWSAIEVDAFGGPELVPDDGESEIARGTADGVGWLLQTRSYPLAPDATGYTGPDSIGPLGPTSVQVDQCLKLSTRERACASPSVSGPAGWVSSWNASNVELADVEFPEFVLVVRPEPTAATLRISTPDATVDASMFAVPGGNWEMARAGVAFVDLPQGVSLPRCTPGPLPPAGAVTSVRIDVLDAAGAPIACAAP